MQSDERFIKYVKRSITMLSNLSKFTLTSWLLFILELAAILAALCLLVKACILLRALIKRIKLLHRIKKLCRERGYALDCRPGYYTSLIAKSSAPELFITTPDKTYAVKFFACLKYKDSYTLTDLNSFYTTNNNKPIFVNLRFPTTGSGILKGKPNLHAITKSEESYIKQEKKRPAVSFPEGTEKLLCIHPMAVEVYAVRTNRPERIFDGDHFRDCTVCSGSGLEKLISTL